MTAYLVARSWNGCTHHQILRVDVPQTIRAEIAQARAKSISLTDAQADMPLPVLEAFMRLRGAI